MQVEDIWTQASELVAALGTPEFGPAFLRVFADPVAAEHCTVFAFPDGGRPLAVLAEAHDSRERAMVRDLAGAFAGGEFVHDPNVLRLRQLHGNLDVFTLTPDQLADPNYRHRFYDGPSIVEELVTLAHICRWDVYLSFYRRGHADRFQDEVVAAYRGQARSALQYLAKHLEFATLRAHADPQPADRRHRSGREQLCRRIGEALIASGHGLTRREAEVCAAIVLGHTVRGIGLNLGISVNTVATHRKRAYEKLGISSQNELFARYFDTVHAWAAECSLLPAGPNPGLAQ